ncbi:MAG: IclR family transcriptional regulator [Microbacteriaceae bacterium]|jgi:IclR family pca regulon transcriptional regulator|nr:IclR family transcriptional regulator [Microbacteriaceae bacterium]
MSSIEVRDTPEYHVRAVERTVAVIASFTVEADGLTLSEVAARAGLDRATARRILLTLRDMGYVASEGRVFRLTPKVLQLGYAYLSGSSLVDIARPHLRRIAAELDESASLTILDGDDIVYLDLATSRRPSRVQINVGTRFRAHLTSMGRVLLGGLSDAALDSYLARLEAEPQVGRSVLSAETIRDQVRRAQDQGWAVVDSELEVGLRGAAVPLHGRGGRVIAAINVSAHASQSDDLEVVQRYIPRLTVEARKVEAQLVGLSEPVD